MENDQELSQVDRRSLRHNYRNLLSDAVTRKNEYMTDSGSLLLEDLERANSLFNKVDRTVEGILDSRFLILSADIGAQRAHQLRIDSAAFDALEYIEKVREKLYNPDEQHIPGSKPNWAAMGNIAARFSRRAPRFSYIYGPLMTEPKERRRIKTGTKRDNAALAASRQEARIETMGESDVKRQENQTTKLVKTVHKILREVGPINLFQLVINPTSFSQSVENIFYVSFLIRDGKAYIDDQSGQPMIEACEPPQQDDYQSGLTKKQLIFSLDQATWREIIDVYAIDESIIPSRVARLDASGLSQISSQVPR
ncbi:hypothetical protein GGI01_001913 [Coemansia sp. RSA 376]|nr:hypothetical protein GGI14_004057 [Coemansia sp. S680]KAJ2026067.1 hypothetical protein H4S03_008713 [Coemansia sp. S3946]KAJ2100801.1 hypothetical protein IW146_009476 [Coemansia sp. RSA 922]KAJ2261941.1 hypothetical protein GGI01_001913 [Coemansia sp. RSA 376]